MPGTSEIFPEDVREYLLRPRRSFVYPLYFDTSCAIALATGQAESLGAWREPVRATGVEPCQCPAPQREPATPPGNCRLPPRWRR